MGSRRAVSEVIGSVSMLAVTIALLAGASVIAMASVRSATSLVTNSAEKEARQAGILISVVTSQANATGSFIWLYNYGWQPAPIQGVYSDGVGLDWRSPCSSVDPGQLCTLSLPPGPPGAVTILLGGVSVEASV